MRKTLSVFTVAFLALVSFAIPANAQREDQFNAYMYVVRGPLVANATAFNAWSTNAVWKLYANQNLSDQDIGYRLTADAITQRSSDLTDETLWFAVRVVSKDTKTMFSLDMLQFSESSSDPGNTMMNMYLPALTENVSYSRRAIGVIWSPGGPRVSDTILDGMQDATNLVNELCFVGMQSKYFQYPLATVDNYISGFTNFLVTGKCEVVNASGMVLATVQRTVQTVGSPISPRLSITPVGGPLVRVGLNMQPGRTAILMSTPQLKSPSWAIEATLNAGDEVVRNMENGKFFRAILE